MAKNEIEEIDPSELEGFEEIDSSELEDISSLKPKKESSVGRALVGTTKGIGGALRSTAESVAETVPDVLTLGAQGLTAGFSDEAIAAARAALEPAQTKESFGDLYEKYKKIERERIEKARERSPYLGTAAEIAGAALPAVGAALLTKGKSIPGTTADIATKLKMAGKIGALEGAIGGLGVSEADLPKALGGDVGEIKEVAADVGGGLAAGAALGPALTGAGHLLGKGAAAAKKATGKLIEDYAPLRQAKEAFESKFKGIDFESDKGNLALIKSQNEFSDKVASDILSYENKLGREVSDTIENATKTGKKIDVSDINGLLNEAKKALGVKRNFNQKILDYIDSFDEATRATQDLYNIKSRSADPKSLYELKKSVQVKLNQLDPRIDQEEYTILSNLSNALKDKLNTIDGFSKANETFQKFRSAVGETIINRGKKLTLSIEDPATRLREEQRIRDYASSLPDYKKKLTDILNYDVSTGGKFGTSGDNARLTFDALRENIKKFEAETGRKIKDSGIDLDADSLYEQLIKQSDIAGVRQKVHGYDAGYGESSSVTQAAGLLEGIYIAPRYAGAAARVGKEMGEAVAKTKPVELSKNIYKLKDDKITELADAIEAKFPSHSKVLRDSVVNKNFYRKNAALFALSQNPDFRNAAPYILEQIASGDEEGEENE